MKVITHTLVAKTLEVRECHLTNVTLRQLIVRGRLQFLENFGSNLMILAYILLRNEDNDKNQGESNLFEKLLLRGIL